MFSMKKFKLETELNSKDQVLVKIQLFVQAFANGSEIRS